MKTVPQLLVEFDSLPEGFTLVDRFSERFVLSTRDKIISKGIYARGEFEFSKFVRVLDLIGSDRDSENFVVIDVGANIGSICIPAVARGFASRAVAFEPEPLNNRLCRVNVLLNALEDQISVVKAALGERRGTAEFELCDRNFGDHRIRLPRPDQADQFGESERDVISVPLDTLDSALELGSDEKAILWIDTQGFEGFVLAGARRFLQHRFPVVIEFWPYGMKRSGCFELLLTTLAHSPHSQFVDLDDPEERRQTLNEAALRQLYATVGEDGEFTDLLLI